MQEFEDMLENVHEIARNKTIAEHIFVMIKGFGTASSGQEILFTY